MRVRYCVWLKRCHSLASLRSRVGTSFAHVSASSRELELSALVDLANPRAESSTCSLIDDFQNGVGAGLCTSELSVRAIRVVYGKKIQTR